MSDNLARDQKFFNCSEEHELKYVSGLYSENIKVYDFLVSSCKSGKIKYSTHAEAYVLIKKELGLNKKKLIYMFSIAYHKTNAITLKLIFRFMGYFSNFPIHKTH